MDEEEIIADLIFDNKIYSFTYYEYSIVEASLTKQEIEEYIKDKDNAGMYIIARMFSNRYPYEDFPIQGTPLSDEELKQLLGDNDGQRQENFNIVKQAQNGQDYLQFGENTLEGGRLRP